LFYLSWFNKFNNTEHIHIAQQIMKLLTALHWDDINTKLGALNISPDDPADKQVTDRLAILDLSENLFKGWDLTQIFKQSKKELAANLGADLLKRMEQYVFGDQTTNSKETAPDDAPRDPQGHETAAEASTNDTTAQAITSVPKPPKQPAASDTAPKTILTPQELVIKDDTPTDSQGHGAAAEASTNDNAATAQAITSMPKPPKQPAASDTTPKTIPTPQELVTKMLQLIHAQPSNDAWDKIREHIKKKGFDAVAPKLQNSLSPLLVQIAQENACSVITWKTFLNALSRPLSTIVEYNDALEAALKNKDSAQAIYIVREGFDNKKYDASCINHLISTSIKHNSMPLFEHLTKDPQDVSYYDVVINAMKYARVNFVEIGLTRMIPEDKSKVTDHKRKTLSQSFKIFSTKSLFKFYKTSVRQFEYSTNRRG
jgi:hypothetical protein